MLLDWETSGGLPGVAHERDDDVPELRTDGGQGGLGEFALDEARNRPAVVLLTFEIYTKKHGAIVLVERRIPLHAIGIVADADPLSTRSSERATLDAEGGFERGAQAIEIRHESSRFSSSVAKL